MVAFEETNNCGIHYLIKLSKLCKFKGLMLDQLSSRLPQVRGAWQTALILSPRPMVLLVEVKSNLGISYSVKAG